MTKKIVGLISAILLSLGIQAQEEYLAPLSGVQVPAHDTWAHKGADTLELQLPFFDDFSNYTGLPDSRRWLTRQTLINRDYALLPPTLGVATLDALNGNGEMHSTATSSLFGADTLASQIVRLDSLLSPTRRKLQPSDSVYLSFFYLPGGGTGNLWERIGDCPDPGDSLMVDFFDGEEWVTVWAIDGISEDSLLSQTEHSWQYVAIPVADPRFFHRRFQFRLRNYCSLDANSKLGMVGNADQWNIDYVYLAHGRTGQSPSFRDVAFVAKAPSALRSYQAMPIAHFRTSDMATHMPLTITNLYNSTLASSYQYNVYDEHGTPIAHYDGGHENIPSHTVTGQYQTSAAHAAPVVNFAYPEGNQPTHYEIVHIVKEGNGGDTRVCNDTLRFVQTLSNYYAYDDGVAENGYGLITTSSKAFLAYRFLMHQPDTLTALDICFNHTRNDENAGTAFYISVWDGRDTLPGTLLYRDEAKQRVAFNDPYGFVRYRLSTPVVVPDSVFVGIEQIGSTFINIGFDRNNDVRRHICYRTTASWQQSILGGALMMRPCFGSSALTGIATPPTSCQQPPSVSIHPNPVQHTLFIDLASHAPHHTMQVFDTHGRTLYQGPFRNQLDVAEWPSGLYLLRIADSHTGQAATTKFLKH